MLPGNRARGLTSRPILWPSYSLVILTGVDMERGDLRRRVGRVEGLPVMEGQGRVTGRQGLEGPDLPAAHAGHPTRVRRGLVGGALLAHVGGDGRHQLPTIPRGVVSCENNAELRPDNGM